jgi:hypothetical protein
VDRRGARERTDFLAWPAIRVRKEIAVQMALLESTEGRGFLATVGLLGIRVLSVKKVKSGTRALRVILVLVAKSARKDSLGILAYGAIKDFPGFPVPLEKRDRRGIRALRVTPALAGLTVIKARRGIRVPMETRA